MYGSTQLTILAQTAGIIVATGVKLAWLPKAPINATWKNWMFVLKQLNILWKDPYNSIWRPGAHIQEEDGETSFSDPDFNWFRTLIFIWQWLYVHSFSLLLQHFLVIADVLVKFEVKDHDYKHGYRVGPSENARCENTSIVVIGQIIEGASC